MNQAYAFLSVKALDGVARTFTGVASTPTPDRHGDVFDPLGATFSNPLPLLLHHDHERPVGRATLTATRDGIVFEATIPEVKTAGVVRDRVTEALDLLAAGLINAVSIGFRPLTDGVQRLKSGGLHLLKTEICELSLVTVPANAATTIHAIKSYDQWPVGPNPPAVAGLPVVSLTTMAKQTTTEQITQWENKRAAIVGQMSEMMTKAGDAGTTLDAEQSETYDELELEVKGVDGHLVRLRSQEKLNAAAATPAPQTPGTPRPYAFVSVKDNVEPGIKMARFVIARIASRYEGCDAVTYAEKRWGDSTPEVALALKAAVVAGSTTDAAWAKPLVNPAITADFLPLLRAATILGKIEGLYEVPFNVNVPAQTAGGTVNWVGELKPKPVSAMAFAMESLGFNKVAAIVVLSQELVRFSNPKAEQVVRNSLVRDIAAYLDGQFINPAIAAVAGVNPASITNGAPTAAASTNPLADIMGLVNHFVTNNIPIDNLAFIMSPSNALSLSFRTNLDGSPEFPGVGVNGGTYKGLQFVTSNTAGTNVVALAPGYIMLADDGGVTIDASTEASLQMDSAPASPPDATTVYASMFQMNAVALRAERYITWKRVGANTVKYLTATAWPAPTGGTMMREGPGGYTPSK